jgi:hypothetical protein
MISLSFCFNFFSLQSIQITTLKWPKYLKLLIEFIFCFVKLVLYSEYIREKETKQIYVPIFL